MYAVVESGGRQYKVMPGESIYVEKLLSKIGEKLTFQVLACGKSETRIGEPYVDKAKVIAIVTAHEKQKKILVFKKKRRQGYRRTQGHRQVLTKLFIESISSDIGSEIAKQGPKIQEEVVQN